MQHRFSDLIRWKKRGLFIEPDRQRWWSRSHGMIPTPLDLGNGRHRIYFSGRNDNNQSCIGWAEVDLNEPVRITRMSEEPVLTPGDLGCFDDNGVTPSCCLRHRDGTLALYYIGWNPGSTVRMHLFGGLALSRDDGNSFTRWSRAPIIERCPTDPFLNTAPFVVDTGDEYRMYYVSGTGWRHKDLPRYNIKMARSDDGRHWRRDGHVCIDFRNDAENALARPYVIHDDGRWKMWFASKGDAYRLGYAESEDGVEWHRNDDLAGLDVSESGFDSDMVEYAAVIRHAGRRFMFYNGNNYGYDGIGLAVEE